MIRSILVAVWLLFPLQQVRAEGPAMWILTDDDTNLYILGSVHVLQPDTPWLDDNLRYLISQADALYLELSAQEQSPEVMQPLVMKYGLLPTGDSLKNHLPEALYTDLASELMALGMPEAQFNRFKPWMATTLYGTYKFVKLGFTPQAGVEATLMALAKAKNIPVRGLETAEFQLALFDNLAPEVEVAFLEQTLADRDNLSEIMNVITHHWVRGETDELAGVFRQAFAGYPELEKTLLTNRNQAWVQSVDDIMMQPGTYFLAVGAGHLVGDDSLIMMLKAGGKEVSRLRE